MARGAFRASTMFDRELPRLPACPHQRLLCRDLGLVPGAEEGVSAVRYGDRAITVTFRYRPRWRMAWRRSAGVQTSLRCCPRYDLNGK